MSRIACLSIIGAAILVGPIPYAQASETYEIIHSFCSCGGGNGPFGVTALPDGSLIGTTAFGGLTDASGVVFHLVPPAMSGGIWTSRVLSSFSNYLQSELTLDEAGAVYGVESVAYDPHKATIFRLTPPTAGQSVWTTSELTTVGDGMGFYLGGVEYARHQLFGANQKVFRVAPLSTDPSQWRPQSLYTLSTDPNLLNRTPPTIRYVDGVFTLFGLTYNTALGVTSIYDVAFPDLTFHQPGVYSTLYTFPAGEAIQPLIADRSPNLFGVANVQMVGFATAEAFRLAPPSGAATGWRYSPLYAFGGSSTFNTSIYGPLTEDDRGRLYGTFCHESRGATAGDTCSLFRLTSRDIGGATTPWNMENLHTFTHGNDKSDGSFPLGRLVVRRDPDGAISIYGATGNGGAHNAGTVYHVRLLSP